MKEPKYTIGQTVYVLPTVNRTTQVSDRVWDANLKPEPSYRYKVASSPAWFPERQLRTEEEMPEDLESAAPDDNWEYDGDTGRALIDGRWVVISPRQWERFLLS